MGLSRLGKKRTKRSRTWAAVCAGLFGGRRAPRTDAEDGDVRSPAGEGARSAASEDAR